MLSIDWPGLRAAACAVGIRQACRQATADLPPDEARRFTERAMKRCSREGWITQVKQAKAIAATTSPSAMSANVRTGAEIVQNQLAEDDRESRISLSRGLRKAAKAVETMEGEEVLSRSVEVKATAQSLALVHRWEAAAPGTSQTVVNIALIGRSLDAIELPESQ